MTPVRDPAALLAEISRLRKSVPGLLTNCLSPRALLETPGLLMERSGDALLLLEDQGAYLRLSFFVPAGAEITLPETDRPILAELLYRAGREPKDAESLLTGAGMALHQRCLGLSRKLEPEDRETFSGLLRHPVETATEADIPALLDLWQASLTPYDFYEGAGSDLWLRQQLRNGAVACIRDGAGQVLAAVVYDVRGQVSTWRHVAVSPQARGRGYARALTGRWGLHALDRGCSLLRAWIGEDNGPSLTVTGSVCQADGRRLDQLILEP